MNNEVVMSNTSTNINIRMDKELKKQFETFCESVGMTMSAAFNVFAKKTVSENKIPFEISAHIPNRETKKVLDASLKGKKANKTFDSSDALMK